MKSNGFCLANLWPLWSSRRMGEPSKKKQILLWLNINSFCRRHRIHCDLILYPSERNMCSCHLVYIFFCQPVWCAAPVSECPLTNANLTSVWTRNTSFFSRGFGEEINPLDREHKPVGTLDHLEEGRSWSITLTSEGQSSEFRMPYTTASTGLHK